jgi:predicted ATPase/class 3 adenylate cyclase
LREEARFCDSCGASVAESPASVDIEALPSSFGRGRYQVRRFLGEGGKKRVYLAHDARLEREVAVGVIKTEGLDATGLARIRREARAMGKLGDHANIVTIYDVGDDDGLTYIVSQYMAGGSVGDLVRSKEHGRLAIDAALRVADEVAAALEYAHAHEVIHRDVKPSNIWLAHDGTAKLGDFGLAHTMDRTRLTMDGMMVGTVAYMSPEQALGRHPDSRSDLYALGASLYEMATSRPPFLGDDVVAVISQHINTPPVAPSWHNPDVPRALEALILRLLAKAPEDRPESAKAVRDALAAIRSTVSVSTAREDSDPNPLDRLAGGVFVGREREMDELRGALEESLSGHGKLILLVGEPGIGKTRTAEELVTFARLRKAQVLWGRCYEGDAAPAFWPWIQAIRAYVRERHPSELLAEMGSGASEIAQVVSEVRDKLPGLPVPPPLEPEQARFRLFDGITTFLRNASRAQPLLIVVDDLHWADRSSLLLLQFVARELRDARVLVVGTYRDTEVRRQHPLSQTLGDLARGELAQRILLRGLTETDVARFIEITSGVTPRDDVVNAVYRETEGNPFFVNEVVRLLVSEGRLTAGPPSKSWSVNVPESVRDVIGRRLDRLSADCNKALTIAAVVGREFDLAVLMRFAELSDERLLDALDEALAARVVTQLPTVERYAFSHALVRETLVAEVTPTRRARLHRKIGETLEALAAEGHDIHLAEISHHFAEAARGGGDVEKAIEYSMKAAERATALVAYDEAVAEYEQALQAIDLCRSIDEMRRCEILLALGEARDNAGNAAAAKEAFLAVAHVARTLGANELVARAALAFSGRWIGIVEVGTVNPNLIDLLEEALRGLGDSETPLQARLLGRLAAELYFVPGTETRRDELSNNSVAIARRCADAIALCETLRLRHIAVWGPDNADERIRIADEMIAESEKAENREETTMSCFWRLADLLELGDVERYEVESERFLARTADTHFVMARWARDLHLCMRALMRGDFVEAEKRADAALASGQGPHPGSATLAFVLQTATGLMLRGRLPELEPMLGALAAQYPKIAALAWSSALTYSVAGRVEDTRREFTRLASEDFRDIPRDLFWLATMLIVVAPCITVGDTKRARILYDQILPYADRHMVHGYGIVCWGSVARILGGLAATLERWDDAERHFERAIAENRRSKSWPFLALTEQEYAAMLLSRGDPGDRERAVTLLSSAIDRARAIGATLIVERALALRVQAQGVVAAAPNTSIDAVVSIVRREKPDLRSHLAPDGTVTIVFTDVEESTRLIERLGDERAQALFREHNDLVRDEVRRHGGFEVKSQGDGFMLAFNSARKAVRCAIALQRDLSVFNTEHPDTPLHVRIGLHTGEALRDREDFFGRTVIAAARILSLAKGDEIVASSMVKALLDPADGVEFGSESSVELKGLGGEYRVHRIRWSAPPGRAT